MKINEIKHSISEFASTLPEDLGNLAKHTLAGATYGSVTGMGAGAVASGAASIVAYGLNAGISPDTAAMVAGFGTMAVGTVYGAARGFLEGIESNRHARLVDAAREVVAKPGFDNSLLDKPIKDFVVLDKLADGTKDLVAGEVVGVGKPGDLSKAEIAKYQHHAATLKDLIGPESPVSSKEILMELVDTGSIGPNHFGNPLSSGQENKRDQAIGFQQTTTRMTDFLNSFASKNESSLKSHMRP